MFQVASFILTQPSYALAAYLRMKMGVLFSNQDDVALQHSLLQRMRNDEE
jgi:hypothetical protein